MKNYWKITAATIVLLQSYCQGSELSKEPLENIATSPSQTGLFNREDLKRYVSISVNSFSNGVGIVNFGIRKETAPYGYDLGINIGSGLSYEQIFACGSLLRSLFSYKDCQFQLGVGAKAGYINANWDMLLHSPPHYREMIALGSNSLYATFSKSFPVAQFIEASLLWPVIGAYKEKYYEPSSKGGELKKKSGVRHNLRRYGLTLNYGILF